MTDQAGKVGAIDPDGVPGPHTSRIEPLPSRREVLDAECLGQILRHRYPGIEVKSLEQLELFDSHTTKIRLKVDFNEAGRAAVPTLSQDQLVRGLQQCRHSRTGSTLLLLSGGNRSVVPVRGGSQGLPNGD